MACIPCLLRPIHLLGLPLFGSVLLSCPHSDPSKVQRWKFAGRLSLTFFLIFGNFVVYLTYQELTAESEVIQTRNIFEATVGMYCVQTVLFLLNFNLTKNSYVKFNVFLDRLLEIGPSFGISHVLSDETVTKLTRVIRVHVVIVCASTGVFVLLRLLLEKFSLLFVLRLLCGTLMFFIMVSLGSYILALFVVYDRIFGRVLSELETCLKDGLDLVKIQGLQRFHVISCKNYSRHILSFGNLFYYLVIFVFTVLFGIASFLYLTQFISNPKREDWVITMDFVIRIMGFTWVIFLDFCYLSEKIALSNQDLLSVLHKHPTTKLSEIEASQVEMFIVSLTLMRPEVSASHIFTLGNSLLCSITANIVTYILVSVQFYITFSKHS